MPLLHADPGSLPKENFYLRYFDHKKMKDDNPIELPIDGTLDLHAFHPREVKELVPDYLQVCREKGILQVRIIHGKGTGSLRRTVHALLDRLPDVASYRLGGDSGGGWGATIVLLRPLETKHSS